MEAVNSLWLNFLADALVQHKFACLYVFNKLIFNIYLSDSKFIHHSAPVVPESMEYFYPHVLSLGHPKAISNPEHMS